MLRFTLFALLASLSLSAAAAKPKLVLQITVDGLRGDMLQRDYDKFGSGGFRFLLDEGAVYTDARYLHANTETIVGHTTLATGATPAVHGMVGNVWYHADTGELGYNIEDPDSPLLPTREEAVTGAQVDPAQKRARSKGRSPTGILVPTFSDTLAIATAGEAKIFGISGKDRSAVAMAGKTGTAYWYSTDTGDFVTSGWYMDAYPEWVRNWNGARKAEALAGTDWELLLKPNRYRYGAQDDRPYEVDLRGYGRVFPHPFGPVDDPLFPTRLLVSPEGDKLLADFARALIEAEQIGRDEVTDFLSISFSGVDAVNHFFGPSSLENEDTVLQLDRTLSQLLDFIDRRIGLENVLVVLSADHGMAEMPEYTSELGFPAGRLYADEVLKHARQFTEKTFGSADIVKDFFRPYLYLDGDALAAASQERAVVAAQLARELATIPGIGAALPSNVAQVSSALGTHRAIAYNHHPQRSGDIYVAQAPYWFMFDRGAVAAMHGSPWSYDQHVPIVFLGIDIPAQQVKRRVHPIDVAPTLSALLGLSPPAGAQGEVLAETLPARSIQD